MRNIFKKISPSAPQGSAQQHDGKDEGSEKGLDQVGNGTATVSELSYSASDDSNYYHLERRSACEIMAETLFRSAQRRSLFSRDPTVWNGVALRLSKGCYVQSPQQDYRLGPWLAALEVLNVTACISLTSRAVCAIAPLLPYGTEEIAITPAERIQVLESIDELATARKAQGAAFVRPEGRLLVWTDKVEDLMVVTQQVEAKFVKYIWQQATGTCVTLPGIDGVVASPGREIPATLQEGVRTGLGGEKLVTLRVHDEKNIEDPEKLETHQERSTVIIAPVLHGLAFALAMVICSLLLRSFVIASATDGTYLRLAITAVLPLLCAIVLFFADNIIGSLCMLLGPIRQMNANTKYYSSIAPERMTSKLPHITIQMPVYKEALDTVLAPTIESLNKAIRTYELQGGSASILVSEDGLLLVSEKERKKRLEFYDLHHVAWVARPGHNVDGYTRAGRFKKASNLNFTCSLSLAVERIMASERPSSGIQEWTQVEETGLYESALARALAEAHPLAQASGNIRIGELILLIDCDTRVPEDCFLDAASEMTQCPEVAILQHCSGVMLVTENNYFEKGIGFFTRSVNFAISYCVANGDTAPFMGHNAYLRWSAVQEVAVADPGDNDGHKKIWAEWTVSEDFEMSIRLLMAGYITRWATYSKNGYLEGVSLTCQDELNRWQKYAFGVSELVFHPIHRWIYKGPFTPLFRRYIWAKEIPTHAKAGVLSYVFSYYAIGAALPLCIGLTLVQLYVSGLYAGLLQPFQVFVAVVVVFAGVCNLSQMIAKFRSRTQTFAQAVREHITWLVFSIFFFSGLSYHVLTALVAHLVSYNMTWSSTIKDLEDSNFFREVPEILKKNWTMLLFCVAALTGFGIIFSDVLPIEWQGHGGFFVWWPPVLLVSGHIVYHLGLNPQLLRFSF